MLRALVVAAFLLASPALAQEGAPVAPAAPIAFAPVVDRLLDESILPSYAKFSERADAAAVAIAALCAAPGADALAAARAAFGNLAVGWSRVEMFRIGPARADNRFERLFFWPDRKGLGLRQVQAILAEEDATATDVTSLRSKSVAVQGLLALEYVLYGTDSDTLATAGTDSFRCRYGEAIAGAIAATAAELVAGWNGPDGYAAIMRNTGPDNPVYRTHGEVVQDILRSAREQIQIDRDIKIARPIGDSPAVANARLAPFWRSDLTLRTISANIGAVSGIVEAADLGAILPPSSAWMAETIAFELSSADLALERLDTISHGWEDAVTSPSGHDTLAYTLIPLGSAFDILEQKLPVALGVTTGFNTLDGD